MWRVPESPWPYYLFAAALAVAALAFPVPQGAQVKPTPEPPPVVNQHFKVVHGVAPADLQKELERLNAEGYHINTSAGLFLTGDETITIIVDDSDKPSDEEEADDEQ
jgi:hypothetical protein